MRVIFNFRASSSSSCLLHEFQLLLRIVPIPNIAMHRSPAIAGLVLFSALTAISRSEDTGVFSQGFTGDSVFDRIWSGATFYKDNENPFIEEFDFIGRVQFDYFNVDSNRGDNDYAEIRRLRLGEDSFFFNRYLETKAEVDTSLRSYGKDSVFYNRMTNLYLDVHADPAFNVRIGKQEPHFGYDREQSDNLQPFFERSFFDDNVFNKTGNDYQTAATVYGKVNDFGYLVSMISEDVDREFGEFRGGAAYLAELNYDFKKAICMDKALWAFDYMHTENNVRTDVFNTVENAMATYVDFKKGPYGGVAQVGYAEGIGSKGDFYQLMVMPTYDITSKLQAVFRYQYGHGSEPGSIGLINRQDATIGKYSGDVYNAAYLGMNYFLYGYKARLMAGVEYFDLSGNTAANSGNSGWTTLVGFRIFW